MSFILDYLLAAKLHFECWSNEELSYEKFEVGTFHCSLLMFHYSFIVVDDNVTK